MSLKELQEKRHALAQTMRSTLAEATKDGGKFEGEPKQRFEQMDADLVAMDNEIQAIERLANIDATARNAVAEQDKRDWQDKKVGVTPDDRRLAFRAWAMGDRATPTMVDAAKKCRFNYQNAEMPFDLQYRTTGPIVSGTTGANQSAGQPGSSINPLQVLYTTLKTFGGMRGVSKIVQSSNGQNMPFPIVDDTTVVGAIVGQGAALDVKSPDFGAVTIGTFKYTSKFIKASLEMVQDAGFDLESWIFEAMGIRIARATNADFTTGSGSGAPFGVVAMTGTINNSAATTGVNDFAISTTGLIALVHSVDPYYRLNGRFMFHDQTLKKVKALTDTTGRPLWLPGISAGEPDTLLGYRYEVNNSMTTVTSGTAAKWAIFGDFSKYVIRDVTGMTAVRVNERFIDTGEVGFVALSRHGGSVVASTANGAQWPFATASGSTT